jgi:epoxyqueuosine reductase QueG
MTPADLETRLQPFGLHLRGVLQATDDELKSLQSAVENEASIALVGNLGSSYWSVFVQSPEYQDGLPDALDRWSRRIAEALADEIGAKAFYPFEGPPYLPFLQWAKRAESLNQSRMGLMIHPQYGLWHSYRFGLLIPDMQVSEQQVTATQSPCESCETQPCLNTCPVGAFDANGYDVDRCAGYLKQTPDARCHQEGCLARLACPVGQSYRYQSDQHCFHLRAFLAAR